MTSNDLSTLESVKNKHEDRLKRLPNVTAVGIGPKIRNGRATGEMAVKVFVTQKLPPDQLAEDERIPEQLDGFPTDVELLAPLEAR